MTDKVAAYEKELKSLKITTENMRYELSDHITKYQTLFTEKEDFKFNLKIIFFFFFFFDSSISQVPLTPTPNI